MHGTHGDAHWSPSKFVTLWSCFLHYRDVIMSAISTQITGVSIVCAIVCLGADQRKHQSSASLAFVRGIHRWPVDSPHKGPVTQTMFPFDDVIMCHTLVVSPWMIGLCAMLTSETLKTKGCHPHWLHPMFSSWQPPMQPVTRWSSIW